MWLDVQESEEQDEGLSPEDAGLLKMALRAMRQDDQAMLVAYFIYGFTEDAIAEVEGVCRQAIQGRIARALVRTRKRLGIIQ